MRLLTRDRLIADRSTIRFVLLAVLLLAGYWTVQHTSLGQRLEREELRQTFESISADPWSPVYFVLATALSLLAAIPATPLVLVGGVVFGTWPGTLYNWSGMVLGSCLAFLFSRYFARDFVQRLLGARLLRLDRAIAERGFWAIFSMRMIPVVPFNLSNFAVGLTQVAFLPYVLATSMAIVPVVTVITYFADALWNGLQDRGAYRDILLAGTLMLLLAVVPWVFQRHFMPPRSP